jgi:hypothetical protein
VFGAFLAPRPPFPAAAAQAALEIALAKDDLPIRTSCVYTATSSGTDSSVIAALIF